MLEVRLIGTFAIQQDAREVVFSSRAAQSLFAYLIFTAGAQHRREKLAGMFWPEAMEEKARAYLRYELWRIRKALTKYSTFPYILADDICICFNPESDYWLDVTRIKNISERASVTEMMDALSLYRGELLPGFYEEWITLEREYFRASYEHKLERLLQMLDASKDWHAILEWAERWIALGHEPEVPYRYLMAAYNALGDRAKMISTYQRCLHALRAFGLEPSEQTHALAGTYAKKQAPGKKRSCKVYKGFIA